MIAFTAALMRKLIGVVPVLFAVSLATFFLIDLVPGDPAAIVLGANATPEQLEVVREELDLDKPVHERYLSWLGGVFTGDLGRSYVPPEQTVASTIASRLPVTLELAAAAMLIAVLVSVPLGLLGAHRAGTRVDAGIGAFVFTTVSIPSFLMALFLIFAFVLHRDGTAQAVLVVGLLAATLIALSTPFAVRRLERERRAAAVRRRLVVAGAVALGAVVAWRFFPNLPRQGFSRLTAEAGLWENVRSIILPAAALALVEIPVLTSVLRSDTITTLQQDYILFARSAGLSDRRILLRHALRPSIFTFISILGVSAGRLIGGTVIVETIFAIPGMGGLMVNAAANKDFRMVQGAVLVIAAFYVVFNALVDVASAHLDPRTRRAH